MEITKKTFGVTSKGDQVTQYILKNDFGFQVNIINYGAIITDIFSPDKNGVLENVVLGYDNIAQYEKNAPYFGAVIGRTAGRIAKGYFKLNDTEYQLALNNGENSLHGGLNGFDKAIWQVEEIHDSNFIGLDMTYLSKENEEGYPGNLKINVKYTINNDNKLEIFYHATTDKTTIVNLTNHTYFNLSGNLKENIYNHSIMINSSHVVEVDNNVMPTGKIIDVENTIFDLRNKIELGEDLFNSEELSQWNGFDHPFILNDDKKIIAVVEEPVSGRKIEVESDQNCLVFYSGNQLGYEEISNGKTAKKHSGLCLELQEMPANIEKVILKPNETYENYCSYKFLKSN